MRRIASFFFASLLAAAPLYAQSRTQLSTYASGSASASANAGTMAYSTSSAYHVGDVVTFSGGTYLSLVFCSSTPCASPSTTPANWLAMGSGSVSVNGKTGSTIALSAADVGAASASDLGSPYAEIASNLIKANQFTFSDGTNGWCAAPFYCGLPPSSGPVGYEMYGADTILTMLAFPERFQAADFLNLVNKFVGAKNTNGSATYPVGDFPEVVKQDGTAGQFCSGDDLYCHYATGDGRIAVPLALYLYWKRTGDLTPYTANVAAIKTALAIPPRNGSTGCINIVAGQEDIPGIGYLEQMRPIGDVADASVWMAYDYEALYLMATAAGDTSNASIFNTQFTSLQTCVTTTLTDSSTKMLWFATGSQMHELDIADSTLAAYPLLGSSVGPLLSGTQITSIGTWLDSNYSSLVDTQGYAKMVNACDVVGKIPSGGGTPYTSDGTTTTSYQCGFWATFGGYFADILSKVDLASAQTYMKAFLNGMSPGVEHYDGGTPALGNAPLLITAGQSIRLASELIPMDVPPITTVLCAVDSFGRCTNYLPGDVNVGNFHDPALPIPFLLKQTGTYAYSGFNTIDAYLFPNAANGATLGMALGTAISSNNILYLSFHPNGSGSTSNFGSLDLWGHNNELTWWPSGDVGVGGASTDQNKLFWVGSTAQFNVDASGNTTAPSYTGPASAPSGTCATAGQWVFSKDGHATYCPSAGGTWATKI